MRRSWWRSACCLPAGEWLTRRPTTASVRPDSSLIEFVGGEPGAQLRDQFA